MPAALRSLSAGTTAGGIAAVAAALVSLPLRSPDEIVANSLTVAVGALVVGLGAGVSWHTAAPTSNAAGRHAIVMAGAFVAAMALVAVADRTILSNLLGYAVPLAALIFVVTAVLTPLLAAASPSSWWSVAAVVVALGIGVGLFGRGNVASGELTLEDLGSTSTTEGASTTLSGTITVPDGLADRYAAGQGVATYEVPENLRGLDTVAVGRSETLAGTIVPGGAFELTVDLTTFVSDQDLRDGRLARMFSAEPIVTFSGPSFPLPASVTVGEVIPLDLTGTLTVNGVSREVTWSLEVQVREDGIAVTGETDIVLTDFDVTPPQAPGITVQDAAHLEVLFLAVPA